MGTRTDIDRITATGAPDVLRRFYAYRTVWHTTGPIVPLIVAWLVFRAHRQVDFTPDFVNRRLC